MTITFYLNDFRFILSREERVPLVGLSHVLLCLAKQMLTAYHNNIKEHFVKRLLRFINQTVPKDENIAEAIKKAELRKWKKKAIFKKLEIPEQYKEWAIAHLNRIIPSDIVNGIEYDVKVNPNKHIPCLIYMNRIFEEIGTKLF